MAYCMFSFTGNIWVYEHFNVTLSKRCIYILFLFNINRYNQDNYMECDTMYADVDRISYDWYVIVMFHQHMNIVP